MNLPINRSILSTGIIARYCETTITQVNRWINSGNLCAFRTPGGQYRITKDDFRDFLERFKMPIREEFFRSERKKRILVADDDDSVVEVIRDIIQDNFEDIDLKTACNGYEALITAGSFKPDLLILDMRMPKIDGLEVCRRLRDNDALSGDMKILAMTAHSDAYNRKKVMNAGADEYLIKPVDMEKLLEHIEVLL